MMPLRGPFFRGARLNTNMHASRFNFVSWARHFVEGFSVALTGLFHRLVASLLSLGVLDPSFSMFC